MRKRMRTVSFLLLSLVFSLGGRIYASDVSAEMAIAQQTSKVTGMVIDNFGPVAGASVVIKGTTNGVMTDMDGKFVLSNVKKGDIVQISYIGYVTQEIPYMGQASLEIQMKEDTQQLDEVVVVGFGTQKKVNLTGSVATVDAKELASRPVSNVTQALQGVVPGMNFNYGGEGAKVGSTMSINIRGVGTLNENDSKASPLILIDGMEGDMNMLNPNDIENISVLKDAAAASIYGSRAPYGVVLITTKKGKEGRATVNYNNSFRWSQAVNMPKMANSYDYAMYINEIGTNSSGNSTFQSWHLQYIQDYLNGTRTETTFPDVNTPTIWDWRGNANVDWLDEIFGGTGFSQEHSLSVNGGSEKVQYYLSANYLSQQGIVRYGDEGMKRYNLTAKINAKLASWLKVNYSTKFIRQDLDQPYKLNDDLFYYDTMRRWPTQPVLDSNGNYLTELPKYLMLSGNNKTQTDQMYQQLQFVIEPIKNWKTYVELNYQTTNFFGDYPRNKTPKYDINGDIYYDSGERSQMGTTSERTNFFNTNIYSEYTYVLDDLHTFKGMVGFQAEENSWKRIGLSKYDMISESVTDVGTTMGEAASESYGRNHWATAGFFGRINYDYAGRYLAEVNLRYDASSRFSPDTRWALFPSFSLGWNIAREEFWEPYTNAVNTLKLRGSWGQLGNQNTTNLYTYIQTMPFYPSTNTSKNTWLINGNRLNGSTAPGLISSTLTWETMSSWNIGADFGFLNNRLTASFDYFVRKTFDMVGPAPELPEILGTAVPRANNADLQSNGFELDLTWRDQIKDFSYGVHFLLSDDRQKVLKYPNDAGSLGTWRNGQYLNEIWGYTTIGIAKSQEEMDAHLATLPNGGQFGTSGWTEGDIMYADLNGDGVVNSGSNMEGNSGDWTKIGDSTPRFKFGLDLDASWKGFDLRIFLQGVAKRDYVFGSGHLVYWGNAGGVWNSAMFESNYDFYRPADDTWLGANQDAKFPRLLEDGKNRYAQTRFLENAAYIRLKNLQIGYTLPKTLTQKAGISNLRIFFSGENLFTITGLPDGIEPETIGIGDYGNGSGSYPLTRVFSTGFSVNF